MRESERQPLWQACPVQSAKCLSLIVSLILLYFCAADNADEPAHPVLQNAVPRLWFLSVFSLLPGSFLVFAFLVLSLFFLFFFML